MVETFLKKKKTPILPMTLNTMCKQLGIYSEDLDSGILDDNKDPTEPLRLITIDPNESQYQKPVWSNLRITGPLMLFVGSLPFPFFPSSNGIDEVIISKLPLKRINTPKPTIDLTNIKQLAAPKSEKILLLPRKTTRKKYQMLSINFYVLEWSIQERHPIHLLFKVNGRALERRVKDAVYLVGRDSHTQVPYLLRLPPDYISRTIMDCLEWCIQVEKLQQYAEI